MTKLFDEDAEAPALYRRGYPLTFHSYVGKNLSTYWPPNSKTSGRELAFPTLCFCLDTPLTGDENLVAATMCLWNSATNTFDFRVGLMTPILLDMAYIFGIRPHGRLAYADGYCHRWKSRGKLSTKFSTSTSEFIKNYSYSNFLKWFNLKKKNDQQHMLFLLYWLKKLSFPTAHLQSY